MKRLWMAGKCVIGLAMVAVFVGIAAPSYAIEEFFKEFQAYYTKPHTRKRNEIALNRAIEQAKCTICHLNDDKHKLTPYGTAIAVRINKFDKGKKKKIQEAFEKAALMHSDSYDRKSPTFGQQLKRGKLPEGPQ